MAIGRRVCVVGAGWAGIAAAVTAVQHRHTVTLIEMAARPGGRARRVDVDGVALDNGQHILIGAYHETLRLMAAVGVRTDEVLERRPLELVYPDGSGLMLPRGTPWLAFARGVLSARGWAPAERWALLRRAAAWGAARFRCAPAQTVASLAQRLPQRIRSELIEPLCVAALNTPPSRASADAFLRVLRDALFSGDGSADLLLPRRPLDQLLPEPAATWLAERGAVLRFGERVTALEGGGNGWTVDGMPYDAVVLACSAAEAARLTRSLAPEWSDVTAALDHEPIVTAYFESPGSRLPRPMMALHDGPAQFVFDRGALGASSGLFAAVVSGARDWVERGTAATADAVRAQLLASFPRSVWQQPLRLLRALTEKRATFSCTPGLRRPPRRIAPSLVAAGDYVEGPYPATLEGAVQSGLSALAALDE